MVKLIFIYEKTKKILTCENQLMKEIFKKFIKMIGSEYEVNETKIKKGKIVEYYNYEFSLNPNKILNPELPLITQVPGKECIIFVRKRLTDLEKISTELIEEFKSTDKNMTYFDSLEQLNQYGCLVEKKIEEEKKKNPENFIEIKEALKQEEKNNELFILGKIGESLEKIGIKTVIDKRNSKNKENVINNQFISSGLLNQTKFEFHIKEDDIEKRDKILNDKSEQQIFKSQWIQKLSKELDIPINEIIITNIREGSITFDVIIKSNFNRNKMEKMAENNKIIEIREKNIMGACRLTPDMLDKRGNRAPNEWAKIGEKRGNIIYNPPDNNWVGYGLKVLGEFEDDEWIAMNGNPKEWAVAYHGTSSKAVVPICSKNGKFWSTLKEGATGQKCRNFDNINPLSKNKYPKCDIGSYCSPNLEYAEKYVKDFKDGIIIMCRVNPNEIRIPKGKFENDEYITDGTKNTIRPYRILVRLNDNKKK